MMKRTFLLFLLPFLFLGGQAKIKLPAILGDKMVLQRSASVNLWGWATPSQEVTVQSSWDNQLYKTKSDKNGKWLLQVQTPEAGGPYSIDISDGEALTIKDVLIGEVWICSGQSNMEMPIHGFYGQPVEGAMDEMLEANQYPNIRLFTVSVTPKAEPQEDCGGSWLQSSPENVGNFSAVAYIFGKNLNKVLNIPIGLITPNAGGTGIEAWMSEEAIKETTGINQELAFQPVNKWESTVPSHLYNGMIHPITNFTARGFIWYQGESNQHNYFDYDKLMASMVQLWRKDWKNAKMPFYYVQLAPFTFDGVDKISLPLTIEAQYKALGLIPHSGIVPTTDLGHPTAIHHPRKRQVAQRLAALALKHTYDIPVLPDAPVINQVTFEGSKAILTFKNIPDFSPWAVGSFNYFTGELKGFEIAATDRKFYPATAKHIENQNRIEVLCEEVSNPVAVRYAFRNYPDANVMTTEGLPLAPFRTDNWDDSY